MKIRMFTLPNAITLVNLALGCGATVMALSTGGRLNLAFWLIVGAVVCDFADGFAARMTKQYSKIGAQLDSLADMVSFGVAPSAVLFTMYRGSLSRWGAPEWVYEVLGWGVFAVALFAALRLARFNVDDTEQKEFKGLPSPAAGLAVAALGWMWYNGELQWAHKEAIVLFTALAAWLLVCPIRMFSLKSEGFGWKGNQLRYVFLICSAALVAMFQVGGVAMSVGLYVLISIVRFLIFGRRDAKTSGGKAK